MSIKTYGIKNMKINNRSKLLFICFFMSFLASLLISNLCLAAETFYTAGRGTEEKGAIWKYRNGIWSVHSKIKDCSEIFCIKTDKKGKLWAAGNYFDYGTVWHFNGKKWDTGTRMKDSRGLYSLAVTDDGKVWTGGTGEKNVWHYNGNKWSDGVKLSDCTLVYSIAVDDKGHVYAGGEGKKNVWYYNGTDWDDGIKLRDCSEIFALFIDKNGAVWAGGRGGKAIWCLPALNTNPKNKVGLVKKWSPGMILLDCSEISGFTEDSKDILYAVGAGKNKIWEKDSEDNWKGINLENCIALYSAVSGKNKIFTAGWNTNRKGCVWIKSDSEWDKGKEITDCYVLRTLAVTLK